MGQILRNWRITLAAFLSVVAIIGGTFLLARDVKLPSSAEASAESALLQAIAGRDSDGDGLADWSEALYGTNPHTTDTFELGMTDGEAVTKGLIVPKAIADIAEETSATLVPKDGSLPPAPTEGTLTDAFAKSFFTLYIAAKQENGGADLTEAGTQDIVSQALNSLSSAITTASDYKTVKDLKISGSGIEALNTFAADVETVLIKNQSDAPENDLFYLKQAVEDGNTQALATLAAKAKAYRDASVGLSALTVPRELATSHLAFVNALMRLNGVVSDFARVNDDPLATMLALQQYIPITQSIGRALADIGTVYATESIVMVPNTPGAAFIDNIANLARQATTPP